MDMQQLSQMLTAETQGKTGNSPTAPPAATCDNLNALREQISERIMFAVQPINQNPASPSFAERLYKDTIAGRSNPCALSVDEYQNIADAMLRDGILEAAAWTYRTQSRFHNEPWKIAQEMLPRNKRTDRKGRTYPPQIGLILWLTANGIVTRKGEVEPYTTDAGGIVEAQEAAAFYALETLKNRQPEIADLYKQQANRDLVAEVLPSQQFGQNTPDHDREAYDDESAIGDIETMVNGGWTEQREILDQLATLYKQGHITPARYHDATARTRSAYAKAKDAAAAGHTTQAESILGAVTL